MSSRQSSGSGSCAAMLSRLPAIDLIGASELFSSWPSTRISRCHASRSCCRSGTLTSLNTTSVCGRPPCRNDPRRTCHWPLPPGNAMFSTCGALPSRHAARLMSSAVLPQQLLDRTAEQPLAGAIHQPQLALHRRRRTPPRRSRAITVRSSAVGLERAEPLVAQRVGKRIDLEQRLAERIVAAGAARAKREIAFAQRLQQVRHRLQRKHDAMPKGRGGERPEHEHGDARP